MEVHSSRPDAGPGLRTRQPHDTQHKVDGTTVEGWHHFDPLGMLQQPGVIAAPRQG
jgi:hypothetical protein